MTAAVIWLIAGLALIAAEVLSGEFVLLMIGGGALAAAGA
jgi:membrane protein implicated in regulation of membrane protease activity